MIVSFYRNESGLFTGRRFQSDQLEIIEANTPDGCGWIKGAHDKKALRVVIVDGVKAVVPYTPQAEPDRKRRASILNQLRAIDERLIRYLDAKDEGTLDEEGARRLARLRARKIELRQTLQNG